MLHHFQYEELQSKGLDLSETEEMELMGVLNEYIEAQMKAAPDTDPQDLARNLAGLAFSAGRSFQVEQEPEQEETNDGSVTIRISARKAAALIEFLLGDD